MPSLLLPLMELQIDVLTVTYRIFPSLEGKKCQAAGIQIETQR